MLGMDSESPANLRARGDNRSLDVERDDTVDVMKFKENMENCMVHTHKKHGFVTPDIKYL